MRLKICHANLGLLLFLCKAFVSSLPWFISNCPLFFFSVMKCLIKLQEMAGEKCPGLDRSARSSWHLERLQMIHSPLVSNIYLAILLLFNINTILQLMLIDLAREF